MIFTCPQGCTREIGMSESRQLHRCKHGLVLQYAKPLKGAAGKKRSRGISPASPAQRRKVRNKPCVGCGLSSGFSIGDGGGVFVVDPAHLWDRSRGGCDDELCVVALCRDCHRAYDRHELDLLPKLIDRNCFAEMAHVIEAHHVSPTQLLERLTGTGWVPVAESCPKRGGVAA